MSKSIKIVESYECPECGSLLPSEEEAMQCLVECEALAEKEAILADIENKREEYANSLLEKEMIICNEAESIGDIKILLEKYYKEHHDVDLKFSKFEFRFNPTTSNSHSCPKIGTQNWGNSNKGVPTSYPGYEGIISFTVKKNKKDFGRSSSLFSSRDDSSKQAFINAFPEKPNIESHWETGLEYHFYGLHSGSGGGGKEYQYDCKIFIDDFPKIKAKYEAFLESQALNGKVDSKIVSIGMEIENKIQDTQQFKQVKTMVESLKTSLIACEARKNQIYKQTKKAFEPEQQSLIQKTEEENSEIRKDYKKRLEDFSPNRKAF